MIKLLDILKEVMVLREAYTDFPTSAEEIDNPDTKRLFNAIQKYLSSKQISIPDPIAINPDNPNAVKITRSLQRDDKFADYMNKELGATIRPDGKFRVGNLTVAYGEGSRGGRGVHSKGLKFEHELVKDLETLSKQGINQANQDEYQYPDLIIELTKELKLKPGNFTVKLVGEKNQSRPLKFENGGPVVAFSAGSAAETLADIIITVGSEKYYLSAKFGTGTTFFNSGVTKIFPASEIKAGEIKNADGKSLLETLGIDNKTFCKVFNEYGESNFAQQSGPSEKYNTTKLQNLIKSGIGEDYYLVNGGSKSEGVYKVDSSYADQASDITSGVNVVYYGGTGGAGKRVDVVVESAIYKFKINIRSKSGGVYPTHIMCDYTKK
jgi:hypothetical protein